MGKEIAVGGELASLQITNHVLNRGQPLALETRSENVDWRTVMLAHG